MSVDHRPYHWYPPAPKELTPAFRMGQGDSPELRGTPPLKEEYKREIAPALAMTLFIRRGFDQATGVPSIALFLDPYRQC
jgi:hypothetical protein